MTVETKNIEMAFGPVKVLHDVSLTVETGRLTALLGPSGSGKTTLLRIIAGLEIPTSGSVTINGNDVTGLPAKERNLGFVFQHYALFRNMTVFENVAFGLRVRPKATRPHDDDIRERVMRLLGLVKLDGLERRYPSQLSGGQRQRVALARALAVEPKLLLLDEPFGALDAKVRRELRQWLRKLHDDMHVTTIFVTHDQDEALEVADQLVIMQHGRVVQSGAPLEVYETPASPFVYEFLGNVNLFKGRVADGRFQLESGLTPSGEMEAVGPDNSAVMFVRPHRMDIHREAGGVSSFMARVLRASPAGPVIRVELQTEWGQAVQVDLPPDKYRALELRPGEQVYVSPLEQTVFANDYAI